MSKWLEKLAAVGGLRSKMEGKSEVSSAPGN